MISMFLWWVPTEYNYTIPEHVSLCIGRQISGCLVFSVVAMKSTNTCDLVTWVLNWCKRIFSLWFARPEVTVCGCRGPYAWVQGRRATSKVTATSGCRLTNRYAWVTGRLTRCTCLRINLPLRVPPCKRYPEEVTELKMAALILLCYRQRRLLRRNRIFRDRTNPLHKCNDLELFWQFRFRRAGILQMTNELKEELEYLNRKGALPPVFTGRRTAQNPCQQWTSIARQTVCPGRLQFPIVLFCFFLFFVLFVCLFVLFFLSEEVFLHVTQLFTNLVWCSNAHTAVASFSCDILPQVALLLVGHLAV